MSPAIGGRRRGDPPPSDPAAVVLVPAAGRPAKATIRRAVEAAGGGTVAVVSPLRIHGSAWGFPNPGLMPNATEKAAAQRLVQQTITAVHAAGGNADGQITATRHAGKVVAAAVARRRAHLVLVERRPASRVRTAIEGDLGTSLRRRLRRSPGIEVQVVDRPAAPPGRAGR